MGGGVKANRGGSFTVSAPQGGGWDYGWDFGAHNGKSYSYSNPAEGAKYAFAQYIQQNGLDPNSADAASVAAGLNQLYGSNVFRADGGKRVSYGDEFVDWSGQGKPAGQFFWGTAAPAGSVGGGGGGMASTSGSIHGNGSAGIATGAPNMAQTGGIKTPQDPVHQAIMQLLQQGQQPVTAESVASRFQPVRNAMERQAQIQQQQNAQRAAASGQSFGGGGGSLEGDQASMAEDLASSEGRLMSDVITQEITARRQDVMNAIGAAQGEQKIALQQLLAEYDKALRERALNIQENGQNASIGLQQQGLGLQQQQITNQNNQWNSQFGYNAGLQEYLLNQLFQQNMAS